MLEFKTHDLQIIAGPRLEAALGAVADDYVKLAYAARKEDAYAAHVAEAQKDQMLAKALDHAEQVRRGERHGNFAVWQRVNQKLTGQCVALLR